MPKYILHTVQKGDTLWGISKKYKVEEHKIVQANPEKIKLQKRGSKYIPVIYEGDVLRIPQDTEETVSYKIQGKASLGMGESTEYQLLDSEGNIPHYPSEKISWQFHVDEGNENWRQLRLAKEKTGQKFTIVFTNQKLKAKKIRIEAYFKGRDSPSKLAEFLMVLDGEDTAEIKKLELLDANRNLIKRKLSYAETLFARAQCTGMEGETLYFSLWEDDVPGAGHSKENEENFIATKQAQVVNGRAEVSFSLIYSTMAPIANRKIPAGQKDEGKYHEYYVTVTRYEGAEPEKSSGNVDVNNPDYVPLPPKPQPKKKETPKTQPQVQPKKKEPQVIHKDKVNAPAKPPASAWKEPKIIKVYIRDTQGKVWTRRPKYGEKIRIYIESENMVNRKIKVRIYDKDKFSNDLLHEEDRTINASPNFLTISLTKDMQDKGGDVWYQNIFAEVSLYDTKQTVKSEVIDVDKTDFSVPKPEGVNPVTKKAPEQKKEEKDCVCKQYDLIWGAKVSCEFRKKVVEICKELWGDNRKIEMANGLMAVMAVETGEIFKAHKVEGITLKNPSSMTIKDFYRGGDEKTSRAVGLIQFTQAALEGMGEFPKATDKNRGTLARFNSLNQLKLKYAQMGELSQLEKVKKYLYPQRNSIKTPEDIYLAVFAPTGVGKNDDYVLYTKGTDDYEKNKSVDIGSKGKNAKDGKIQRSEILERYYEKYKTGKPHKVKEFSCGVSPIKKEEPKKENTGKWHDPVDNPQITMYMQSGGYWPKYAAFGLTRKETRASGVHQGLDLFALDDGKTKVYACLSGRIVYANTLGSYGKVITLEISDENQLEILKNRKRNYVLRYKKNGEESKGEGFVDTGNIYFRYSHLKMISVKVGDEVKAGDPIGISGTTGVPGGTCGPHVHFEIASTDQVKKGDGIKYRVNPGYYIYYKNEDELTEEEKKIQERRKEQGKK